jgi:hypothetical protein
LSRLHRCFDLIHERTSGYQFNLKIGWCYPSHACGHVLLHNLLNINDVLLEFSRKSLTWNVLSMFIRRISKMQKLTGQTRNPTQQLA